MTKDVVTINQELSGLLDFTQKDVKKYINEFIDRVDQHRRYEEQVKQGQKKKTKNEDGQTVKAVSKPIKDVSKFLVPGRQICYC